MKSPRMLSALPPLILPPQPCPHCGVSVGTCLPEPEPASLNFWERPDFPVHHRLCACKRCKPRTPEAEPEVDPAGVDPFRRR